MSRKPIPVSDHAVVRYLERRWNVDIEALRRRIGRIGATAAEHEAEVVCVGGCRYVVRNGTVVTVTPKRAAPGVRRKNRKLK